MTIRRTVKRVLDGDTFQTYTKVRGSNYVRIAGKNAPEKYQFGGGEATSKLKRQIQGKTVKHCNPWGDLIAGLLQE